MNQYYIFNMLKPHLKHVKTIQIIYLSTILHFGNLEFVMAFFPFFHSIPPTCQSSELRLFPHLLSQNYHDFRIFISQTYNHWLQLAPGLDFRIYIASVICWDYQPHSFTSFLTDIILLNLKFNKNFVYVRLEIFKNMLREDEKIVRPIDIKSNQKVVMCSYI